MISIDGNGVVIDPSFDLSKVQGITITPTGYAATTTIYVSGEAIHVIEDDWVVGSEDGDGNPTLKSTKPVPQHVFDAIQSVAESGDWKVEIKPK